jgi:hypothetical protein
LVFFENVCKAGCKVKFSTGENQMKFLAAQLQIKGKV